MSELFTPDEAAIASMRLGIAIPNGKPFSRDEVSQVMHLLSREQVVEVERSAIEKIRRRLDKIIKE